ENQRQAGLRLDDLASATAVQESGATALVPGKPGDSELFRRITSTDEFEQMPPADAKIGRLTDEEIETLRRWIAAGGEYESHWSLLPFERTIVPPVTDGAERPRHPID